MQTAQTSAPAAVSAGMTDDELVRRAANGDEFAFECMRRHSSAQVIPLDTALASTESQAEEAMENDPDLQPELCAMRSEVRRLMESRIDSVPEAFRMVFVRRAVEELRVEEVSAALDVPEATLRTRFFRARGLLRGGLSHDVDLARDDAFSFAGARWDRIVAGVIASVAEHREISRSSF